MFPERVTAIEMNGMINRCTSKTLKASTSAQTDRLIGKNWQCRCIVRMCHCPLDLKTKYADNERQHISTVHFSAEKHCQQGPLGIYGT